MYIVQFDVIKAQMRYHCLIVLSVKAGAYPGRIFSVQNNWLKLHWAICVEPKMKGCVCSEGVANWVWGAKRSKESHRLGRDMDHRTMFNFHGTQNRKNYGSQTWAICPSLPQLLKSVSRQLEWRYHR